MDEVKIRVTIKEDGEFLKKWLSDKDILRWFPMCNEMEIDDAIRIWLAFSKVNASLTALINDKPVGSALLYVQSMEKIKHHSLFAIIVDPKFRNKGIGTKLINELIKIAKNDFKLEFLNLEVYENNPAKRLYDRFGFKVFGIQKKCLKEDGKYLNKIMMQKYI